MKTRIDALLRDEAARFAFRFACDDCGHFDEGRARCSLAYPASPRRAALAVPVIPGASAKLATLETCKEFELG